MRRIPWRRKWQPTPVFLPGESHGWRSWWATAHGVAKGQMRLGAGHAHTEGSLKQMLVLPRARVSDVTSAGRDPVVGGADNAVLGTPL